jgi:hypothetical protein
VQTVTEGKLDQLIKQKRVFLRQATKDYSVGGNDMLDDVAAVLDEAKAQLARNLALASVLKESEGEEAYQKECASMFTAWYEKWFGKP